jgi:hypothetical protein
MGQSLPWESMAAGNCRGREFEGQSSSAWGAPSKIPSLGAGCIPRLGLRVRGQP